MDLASSVCSLIKNHIRTVSVCILSVSNGTDRLQALSPIIGLVIVTVLLDPVFGNSKPQTYV
jgi:hypothetical protein